MTRSHLPGIGVGAHAGVLLRRQWGIVGHLAYAKHLPGTDSPDSPTSSQLGLSARYILLPERRSPYFEIGINRTRFGSEVDTEQGSADRSATSTDLRLGGGLMVLSDTGKFLYAPYATVDIGRFGEFEQDPTGGTLNCGACGYACSTEDADPACVGGVCELSCHQGWGDCDANVDSGCETDTSENPNHCGACGVECAIPLCADGVCAVCTQGEKRCNSNAVEVCNASGQWEQAEACSGPAPLCFDGACVKASSAGPSCQDVVAACGPGGDGNCCDRTSLPATTFSMGRSASGQDACPVGYTCGSNEIPEHDVTVSAFQLDTFEVTVGRFRRFLDSFTGPPAPGSGAHPHVSGSGWLASWDASLPDSKQSLSALLHCDASRATWTATPGGREQLPVNCVNSYEPFAFCAWDGGRLPTEAEWELAAAGGSENRLFPWGDEIPSTNTATYDCTYDGVIACSIDDLVPVGGLPSGRSRWGHYDLAGNAGEWVFDTYAADWYSTSGATCVDCANASSSNARVGRGGSAFSQVDYLRATARSSFPPSLRTHMVGFRCAYDN
ncbi:MAG: SUMF1/EgtB/PvdO family nonheme iron enzyme [Myxococcota bacterium]